MAGQPRAWVAALLWMHASQFAKTAEDFGVLPLGMNDYLFGLESRDRFFGSLISVHHGEALRESSQFSMVAIEVNGRASFIDAQ
jgi:hypothetical protein